MTFPELYKKSLLEAIEKIDLVKVEQAISWFRDARDSGRAIFTCGNGIDSNIAVGDFGGLFQLHPLISLFSFLLGHLLFSLS